MPDAPIPTGRFQADYAEKESGVNAMAFVERKPDGSGSNGEGEGVTLLATGGEDGVLRLWELRADARSECMTKGVLIYDPLRPK